MSVNENEVSRKSASEGPILASLRKMNREYELMNIEREAGILLSRIMLEREGVLGKHPERKTNNTPENSKTKEEAEGKKIDAMPDRVTNITIIREIGNNNGCRCTIL